VKPPKRRFRPPREPDGEWLRLLIDASMEAGVAFKKGEMTPEWINYWLDRSATQPARFNASGVAGQGRTFGSDIAEYASSRKISGSDPLQLANMTISRYRRHRGD
jgi:hypothetical protein